MEKCGFIGKPNAQLFLDLSQGFDGFGNGDDSCHNQ
jgi:hypothetical protein